MSKYHRHLRKLGLLLAFIFGFSSFPHALAQEVTPAAQVAVYNDPHGLFTMPIPEGWTDASTSDFAGAVCP